MDQRIAMNPNLLVQYLQKPAAEFTRADIIRYCEENEIEFVNFHYCGWDGKLKTLNFVIHSAEHLENILSAGERVDGSSLFPFIEAGKSDLYVVPKYKTAFRNPFTEVPTLDILCSFYNRDGEPFESSPEYILRKAHQVFKKTTGLEMQTMGELEYYIIADDEQIYEVPDQRGYHESAPFNKFTEYRVEAMRLIAQAGGLIKYGHSEVGNFTHDGKIYEQNEIEFLPTNIEDAADQLVVAKWIMRQLAYQYGVVLTFAPKITVGKAGSGMHVHCKFTKNGKSVMVEKGELSDYGKKAIAGYMMPVPRCPPSATRTRCRSSAWCPIRKPRPHCAGRTATAAPWCACRWAGSTTARTWWPTATRLRRSRTATSATSRPLNGVPPTAVPTCTC